MTRIGEQEDGAYDFKLMVQSVLGKHINLDHADFLKNNYIKTTPHHGRGLFSSRPIRRGELVLCEKALVLPDMYRGESADDLVMYNFNTESRTQRPAQPVLFLQLLQKLYSHPVLTKKFFELDGGKYIRSGKEGELVDGVPIIDTYVLSRLKKDKCKY
jgi:hypothetical protein